MRRNSGNGMESIQKNRIKMSYRIGQEEVTNGETVSIQ